MDYKLIIELISKNPAIITVFLTVLIVIAIMVILIGIWFVKFGFIIQEKIITINKEIQINIKATINGELESLKKEIDFIKQAFKQTEDIRSIYQKIYDNIDIIKTFFYAFNENIDRVFLRIKQQLIKMNEMYQSNYLNGSNYDKSIEVLNQCENQIMEELDDLTLEAKQKFSKVILSYTKFMNTVVLHLLDMLKQTSNKSKKVLLIKTEFESLNKLIMYCKLKYPQYLELNENEIEKELIKYYNQQYSCIVDNSNTCPSEWE